MHFWRIQTPHNGTYTASQDEVEVILMFGLIEQTEETTDDEGDVTHYFKAVK